MVWEDAIRRHAVVLAALIALAIVAFVLVGARPWGTAAPGAQAGRVPPLTPVMQAVLAKSRGFQTLVSYTDRGFEPAAATIAKGQTVRFTNNSREGLHVASVARAYPGSSDCGASAFDSCITLEPQEFWEFTFEKAGTWSYENGSDGAMKGTVTVR